MRDGSSVAFERRVFVPLLDDLRFESQLLQAPCHATEDEGDGGLARRKCYWYWPNHGILILLMLSIALIVPIAVFLRLAGVVLVHVTGLLIRSFAL